MRFFKDTNIDFVGQRRIAFIISSVLILIGLASLVMNKGPKYGIDFLGGTLLELHFEPALSTSEIRSALKSVQLNDKTVDLSNAEIMTFGNENDILIRLSREEKGVSIANAVKKALREKYPNNINESNFMRRQEKVGPKIGAKLKTQAIYAILISMLGILVYVSIRFEFKFAIGAIAALCHDVLITLGLFSILGKEISLAIVAALLTIVGYSLNDTIVVYDRIRENLKLMRKRKLKYNDVINKSINETLGRTVNTSITTLLVVLLLAIVGGPVIFNFAFALILGVLIGTYSSIYVASPLLIAWHLRITEKKTKR